RSFRRDSGGPPYESRRPRQGYRTDAVAGGMTGSLNGRVALVTGSTGEGMGRSTALTLAREGADVVLNHGTNRRTSAANNHRLVDAIERLSPERSWCAPTPPKGTMSGRCCAGQTR